MSYNLSMTNCVGKTEKGGDIETHWTKQTDMRLNYDNKFYVLFHLCVPASGPQP